jgi:hypothetical protein
VVTLPPDAFRWYIIDVILRQHFDVGGYEVNRSNCGLTTVLAARAGKPTVLAAWARYGEEEIPDWSVPVLMGRCETTLVVRQKAEYGNLDPARCLNLGLGKRGNYVKFGDRGILMRSTCFDSAFQTSGFHGAAVILPGVGELSLIVCCESPD